MEASKDTSGNVSYKAASPRSTMITYTYKFWIWKLFFTYLYCSLQSQWCRPARMSYPSTSTIIRPN
jgi:hypothetical protein